MEEGARREREGRWGREEEGRWGGEGREVERMGTGGGGDAEDRRRKEDGIEGQRRGGVGDRWGEGREGNRS